MARGLEEGEKARFGGRRASGHRLCCAFAGARPGDVDSWANRGEAKVRPSKVEGPNVDEEENGQGGAAGEEQGRAEID